MIRTRLRNTNSVRPYVTGMHLHSTRYRGPR
ncbi:hypothetical protein HNR23_002743 [Nocardiopsis mwathae]|uniref:Uncharacterized protein n=1 Tax=Nocardiopsis mwathae TaxID=1472723 RepID=A0A7X0D5W1_9ACTN|nr:hypothetical protein [Nocardiopsis mwathae]